MSLGVFASPQDFMQGYPGWKKWQDIVNDNQAFGLTEGFTCNTIQTSSDLTKKQAELLRNSCSKVVFYETFNPDVSINYHYGSHKSMVRKPLIRSSKASLNVGLHRWNILKGAIEYDTYHSKYSKAQGDGFGIRLGNGTEGITSAKITTRGAIRLDRGQYKLSVKFKESVLAGYTPKLIGVKTKLFSLRNNTAYERVDYIKADKKQTNWFTTELDVDINRTNDYYIEIEPIITGHVDLAPFIGNVLLYKTN